MEFVYFCILSWKVAGFATIDPMRNEIDADVTMYMKSEAYGRRRINKTVCYAKRCKKSRVYLSLYFQYPLLSSRFFKVFYSSLLLLC